MVSLVVLIGIIIFFKGLGSVFVKDFMGNKI